MSSKDKLLAWARMRGVYESLNTLIEGTEKLTDWEWDVGKNEDFIGYSDPRSRRRMVRYGWMVSPDRPLDVDVNKRNNQFGSVFGVDQDEVYRRLERYLPDAVKGGEDDWAAIRDEADAEKFIEFLRSFLDGGDA